ncbi:MAG: HEAT repeat domain-containing protein [Verrucomicrobiota bacterium]|jgi:HEAT repeat protein
MRSGATRRIQTQDMLWWKYQQLRMGNAKSRLAVVEQLAITSDDGAVGPLIFALKDKEPNIRSAAAKALMRFQDRRAVEPLVKMLRDTAPVARAAAAETLGHLGDPVAVNHLVGFLRDADPVVRTIAARSLERLGWKPGTDSHRVLQILAMGNLHQLVALGPEGVTPLLDLLRNGAPNKQFAAAKALGEINDPRVRPAMIEALRKPSPAVRIAALGTLERLAEPTAFSEVEKLLLDGNPSVRGAAVEAASRCGGTRAVPALLRCLKDSSWEVRQAAANALGYLGERSAVDGLCGLIGDPDRDVRESVINALAQIADRRAIVPLVLALLDAESTVRSAATATLQKLDRRWADNEDIRKVAPKIAQALKHPDYWVRFSAGKLLEQLKIDPKNLPEPTSAASAPPHMTAESAAANPAVEVLADLLFDRDRDLRLAAAGALGRLRDHSAASLLTAALRDADFSVRASAQAALAALAAP